MCVVGSIFAMNSDFCCPRHFNANTVISMEVGMEERLVCEVGGWLVVFRRFSISVCPTAAQVDHNKGLAGGGGKEFRANVD